MDLHFIFEILALLILIFIFLMVLGAFICGIFKFFEFILGEIYEIREDIQEFKEQNLRRKDK